jgi:YHS domain-containing protein
MRYVSMIVLAAAVGAAWALEEPQTASQVNNDKPLVATCPLSGKPAKVEHVVEHRGKKVYFCCPNCPAAFAKNPEKFADKVHFLWLQTGQMLQFACPFTGRATSSSATVELGGTKFAFCCANCLKKYNDTPDAEKIPLVFGKIDKGFTPQLSCPVTAQDIKLDINVDYKGKKVFFCCESCPATFEGNPEAFVKRLPQLQAPAAKE